MDRCIVFEKVTQRPPANRKSNLHGTVLGRLMRRLSAIALQNSSALVTVLTFGVFFSGFISPHLLWAENHKYTDHIDQDYDLLDNLVNAKINEAKNAAVEAQESGDEAGGDKIAVEKLRSALKMVLSIPDRDNLLSKLIPTIKKELVNFGGAYESAMMSLLDEAFTTLRNDNAPAVYRATAVVVIKNIMSEAMPLAHENEKLRKVLVKVQQAKLEVPKEVIREVKLGPMIDFPKDLSRIAENALKVVDALIAKSAKEAGDATKGQKRSATAGANAGVRPNSRAESGSNKSKGKASDKSASTGKNAPSSAGASQQAGGGSLEAYDDNPTQMKSSADADESADEISGFGTSVEDRAQPDLDSDATPKPKPGVSGRTKAKDSSTSNVRGNTKSKVPAKAKENANPEAEANAEAQPQVEAQAQSRPQSKSKSKSPVPSDVSPRDDSAKKKPKRVIEDDHFEE